MRRQGSPQNEKKGGHMSGLVQAASRAPGMTRKKIYIGEMRFSSRVPWGRPRPAPLAALPVPVRGPPRPGGGVREEARGLHGQAREVRGGGIQVRDEEREKVWERRLRQMEGIM